MGSDLRVAVLEINKNKEPDWQKAIDLVKGMSDFECQKAVDHSGDYFLLRVGMSETETAEAVEQLVGMVGDCGKKLLGVIETVRDGWEGNHRGIAGHTGVFTEMLITGEMSWGDTPEIVQDFWLFLNSGLAEAAGFLLKADIDIF